MNGNTPTVKVSEKLIRSGVRALSPPSARETKTDSSMNSELTRSAVPTFRDMTFRFIPKSWTGFPASV